MADQFKHLFSPLKIGSMTIPNRVLSTPHITMFAELDWLPGPRQTAYWESKARGEIGLIGTQAYPVHPSAGFPLPAICFHNEQFVPRFKECMDTLHRHGSKVTMQLWHPGRNMGSIFTGTGTWSASATKVRQSYEIPHVMNDDEVWEIIKSFAFAAGRAREAGFDGVEIHGAHGYLVQQFISPLTNLREDDWGGSFEKRLRFPVEIIRAVRAEVGNDYTVGIRVSADEFVDGGYTIEDYKKIAPILANTGKLDYINVSSGNYDSHQVIFPTMYLPLGFAVYLAASIKELVNIPVFCVGRINDPIQAEKILADNQADVIGMNRATIADPAMPKKAREGRLDDIVKCIACNEGCIGRMFAGGPMCCVRNQSIGRELDWEVLKPAAVQKKVVVVGGGPAGLEAAHVAARRGHKVTLIEKGSELGGQTNIAAKAPGRQDLAEIGRYFTIQLPKVGVEVMLNTAATPEMIVSMNPDAVVIATGSKSWKPKLPGLDQPNVVDARDVLSGKVQTGNNVLVAALEHHMVGATCADFLASQGKEVEVINEEMFVAHQVEPNTQLSLYARLETAKITLTPRTRLKGVEGNTVTVSNYFTGEERQIKNVDTVVIAHEGEADDSLAKALRGRVKELHLIGQAVSPRRLFDCTQDGSRLGREL